MNDKMVNAGQNKETGENPKAEQKPEEAFFQEAALFLAETYGRMLDEREQLKTVIDAGVIPYTEEMAIRDLSAVSVECNIGRVQTGNISNIPERIAVLLDCGYVEEMNRRLNREMDEIVKEHSYVCWKIEIVETAVRERMTRMQRAIFIRIFVKHLSMRQIRKNYKKSIEFRKIRAERDGAVSSIAEELELVSSLCGSDCGYVRRLGAETAGFGNVEA